MINVFVNGQPIEVPAHFTVIQACEAANVEIPRFCYHERLAIAGNCRMCLVEVNRAPKPVASCAFPISPDLEIFTDTPKVHKAREGVMEFLLANHPLDCPVCDQGGECDLQDQALIYGHDRGRYTQYTKRAVEDKALGPLIKTIMNRCIHCTRCIRFCTEVAGTPVLGTTGRGGAMEVGTYVQQSIKSELSGNIIDLCPVGALTSKPYSFQARPWELQGTETIDVTDAFGSNIRVDTRNGEVMRIQPRLNENINEEWITDKARFCYDGLHVQRITQPLYKKDGALHATTWTHAKEILQQITNDTTRSIYHIGKLVDAESIETIAQLGTPSIGKIHTEKKTTITMPQNPYIAKTLTEIEDHDIIVFIGSNPRLEAPLLNARIRKRVKENKMLVHVLLNSSEKPDLTYEYTHEQRSVEELYKEYKDTPLKVLYIFGANTLQSNEGTQYKELIEKLQPHAGILHYAASHPYALLADGHYNEYCDENTTAWLFGTDIDEAENIKPKYSIYFGHHGNDVAQNADLILPVPSFIEQEGTYVNTLGITQTTQKALEKPTIAYPIHEILEQFKQCTPVKNLRNTKTTLSEQKITKLPTTNTNQLTTIYKKYYQTDPITRSSKILAQCAAELS